MGLLQDSKSRKKISNDPNNTKWTRDTTTFGQKILRAQGWQPGQFLGAQDAPHAELHSAASASYIRVVLKDDMKGLGFNKAKEDEVTGLDVFSDLLSRLNGKSEAAVQEDVNARLAVKTNRYVEMRWGPMRFVRGGLLVGDKLKEDGGKETSTESEEEEEDKAKADEVAKSKKDKKSKKRKAGDEVEEAEGSEVTETKDKKRRRKDEDEDARAERKKRRKEEKKEKKKSKKSSKSTKEESDEDDSDEKAAKKRAKKGKKDKKRERREKKEEKKRRKAAKVADNSSDNSSSSDSDSDNDNGDSTTAASTPAAGSGTSTPLGNRNFSRSRYIAQKRRAVTDAKALAQIFMVKA
ncbi:G-patch RNA maturation protein [Akanthomyces lecanii RCEF 1005]|uniref:PinX1-related protein 1 n=1 Tax=Akanthomyces lecanii RCEF 1005 TaxID=1081108 RepID=A0A168L019_CORDF|nr:G-patch RNA maturation protein [Akanthomyces lecanii RCEF 1005]